LLHSTVPDASILLQFVAMFLLFYVVHTLQLVKKK
jgi:hypothetical protein